MARRVFISFRFSDGKEYKKELCELFDESEDVIDFSEDEDRSHMTDDSIRNYLYKKLKRTSVTIVILTPNAIEYYKDFSTNKYDDWMYDELRYSLEDRENNQTSGIVAVYTENAKSLLFSTSSHKCNECNETSEVNLLLHFNNLVRKNMINIKVDHKKNRCQGIYDSLEDSYISLVSIEDFKNDIGKYIDNAISKRDRRNQFILTKRM